MRLKRNSPNSAVAQHEPSVFSRFSNLDDQYRNFKVLNNKIFNRRIELLDKMLRTSV